LRAKTVKKSEIRVEKKGRWSYFWGKDYSPAIRQRNPPKKEEEKASWGPRTAKKAKWGLKKWNEWSTEAHPKVSTKKTAQKSEIKVRNAENSL
jgi:hypothetical protein